MTFHPQIVNLMYDKDRSPHSSKPRPTTSPEAKQ
ncbi:hypothetical protein BVRB_3g058240 [Beta vulgaris subsp. vulgaris]|nr:hypothetical protein BVRB_3g058240 [Beta vulgaris subsp. vulgaris]